MANLLAILFWIPAFGVPAPSPLPAVCAASMPCEVQSRVEGPISLSTVSVGQSRIVITNLSPIPYCSSFLPCSDPFVGFEFVFSGKIGGVRVDPASAVDFRPRAVQTTPTQIVVDVTGEQPVSGHKLILDLGRR